MVSTLNKELPKVKIDIKPRPLQRLILDLVDRVITLIAHRRFGKTTVALMKILKNAKPKGRFFYIAPTYRQAKVVAWQMLLDMVPPERIYRKNEVDLYLELTNRCVIELKGGDNPDSLRGVGLDGAVIDEYALMNPSIWTEIIRPALTDKRGWAMFIGTPKGKNHLFDQYLNTKESARFIFKASETDIIPKEELALAKAEMSTDEYNQEFECDFLYFSGQIYKEFKHDIHVIKKPFKVDDSWYRGAVIDYGQVNPTAVAWYAVDFDGRVFFFDEYYVAGQTVKTHAEAILAKKYNLKTVPLLDPSAFAKNRASNDRMYSVADEFEDNGIPCLPAQNDVKAGINRVKEYLDQKKLFVFGNCENLIREFESYRWKDKKRVDQNAPDEPLKVNDHLMDCVRYCILSRPYQPRFPKYAENPMEKRRKEFMRVGRGSKDWYT